MKLGKLVKNKCSVISMNTLLKHVFILGTNTKKSILSMIIIILNFEIFKKEK